MSQANESLRAILERISTNRALANELRGLATQAREKAKLVEVSNPSKIIVCSGNRELLAYIFDLCWELDKIAHKLDGQARIQEILAIGNALKEA